MSMAGDIGANAACEYAFSTVGPFEWLRVDAATGWRCSRCGASERAEIPVFVEWLDRAGAEAQAGAADGLSCSRCDWLEPLDLPLLQYRQADGVGLMMGLPARTARAEDETVIRDTLAVAGSKRELEGAKVVAAVRMAWWGSLWSRPLGPRLLGATPLTLPESEEEAERWRSATVEALRLPDVRAALREFVTAGEEPAALEVLRAHPELISARWRLTVETFLVQLRDDQPEQEGKEAVSARLALLRQARLVGVEQAGSEANPERDSLVALASQLAQVQALHGDPNRHAGEDGKLVQTARDTLALARDLVGEEHEMTHSATLNLAVCVEENGAADPAAALEESLDLLRELAPRLARGGSPLAASVATNLSTLATRQPGSRADRPEEAVALLDDARHIRKLLSRGGRRDLIIALVDEAASLRSRVSGSLRENAARAVELLREALAREAEWQMLPAPERALIRLNLANALSQLREHAPESAGYDEVREAAGEALAAAAELDPHNAVAMQVNASAGAVLIGLYTEFTAAGQPPPEDLWPPAHDALERAFERMKEAHPAHHPNTLLAALNLASAYGAAVGEGVADRERCAELLTYVIEHSRPHEAKFRHAAGVNLAQLHVGSGEWDEAVAAYEIAATAKRLLLEQARTPATRLGEIVDGGDLAGRHALAMAMAERPREAIAVLEESRARLAHAGRRSEPRPTQADDPPDAARATAHLATSAYGTLGLLELPGGALRTFVTTLTAGALKPAMRRLLTAGDRGARSDSLRALAALISPGAVEPLAALLREAGEPVEQLALVACGSLASSPLHCVPDARGRTLADDYDVRNLVSATVAEPGPVGPPDTAVAVIDPDGTLPYARAEREALGGWARSVTEPPAERPIRPWLLRALGGAGVAHLACHGRLDPEDPMRSSFSLGGDDELSVADLAGLAAPELDLVVAPACQSASTSPDAPDELLGVGHALVHAGARTVIASLWDADDAATALVVSRLYRELGQGAHPAAALARAQRFVADLGGDELAALSRLRLAGEVEAEWLPYDLAIELLALSTHPRHRSSSLVFGDPAEWASLSCLEA